MTTWVIEIDRVTITVRIPIPGDGIVCSGNDTIRRDEASERAVIPASPVEEEPDLVLLQ
jgi:hypothetical protein